MVSSSFLARHLILSIFLICMEWSKLVGRMLRCKLNRLLMRGTKEVWFPRRKHLKAIWHTDKIWLPNTYWSVVRTAVLRRNRAAIFHFMWKMERKNTPEPQFLMKRQKRLAGTPTLSTALSAISLLILTTSINRTTSRG